MGIFTGQTFECNNLLSLRVKSKVDELNNHISNLINYAISQDAKRCGNSITAIHSQNNETQEIDIEIYFPIDKIISNKDNFISKNKLYLYNCVKLTHKGNPALLQNTYNKLNEYIISNCFIPISHGFNVNIFEPTKPEDIDSFQTDIYVSVSPNIF